jgi:hypothetical protein
MSIAFLSVMKALSDYELNLAVVALHEALIAPNAIQKFAIAETQEIVLSQGEELQVMLQPALMSQTLIRVHFSDIQFRV